MGEEDYEFLTGAMAQTLLGEPDTQPNVTVQRSSEALCWWCRIDPIDGSLSSLQHPDYRYLCRKCRQIMEIFANHFARLQDVHLSAARGQLMRFIGLRCVAMKLEMQEMRDRVDELLHKAHEKAAWINGVPSERASGVQVHVTHAPRIELPMRVKSDHKKDVE